MEWLLPLVLGALALFYVCQPFWSGVSPAGRKSPSEGWHSLEQLDIDRQLGKIDDDEWEELKHRVPAPVLAPLAPPAIQNGLEDLIFNARRRKRFQLSLESEILIARTRKRGPQ